MTKEKEALDDFVEVVRKLRAQCPWDSVQTHESLKECLVNETEEVLEGISLLTDTGKGENLCEELGDILMQVVLHSIIAEEEGIFSLEDVIRGITRKMKFRHPKIFDPDNKELVSLSWKELKKIEHQMRRNGEYMEIP